MPLTPTRTLAFLILLIFGIICILGSAGSSRTTRINEIFEPKYSPDYTYDPGPKANAPSGYTIGIIKTKFRQKSTDTFIMDPEEFRREIANGIEKILINKGCKVAGPFDSYEEMTYPERERCSFLIEPTLEVDLTYTAFRNTLKTQENVGGPNLEPYAYATMEGEISGKNTMEYVILDPLTQEKLERHKLKTNPINERVTVFLQGIYGDDGIPHEFKTLPNFEKHNPSVRGFYDDYYNEKNADSKVSEALYKQVMPQIFQLISIAEFDHLKKYQEQLKEKKRY